jgi:hypothetical protein
MKHPNIFQFFDFYHQVIHGGEQQEYEPGKWCPARPIGYPSFWYRIKAAWLVFTGKADAILWP